MTVAELIELLLSWISLQLENGILLPKWKFYELLQSFFLTVKNGTEKLQFWEKVTNQKCLKQKKNASSIYQRKQNVLLSQIKVVEIFRFEQQNKKLLLSFQESFPVQMKNGNVPKLSVQMHRKKDLRTFIGLKTKREKCLMTSILWRIKFIV